MAKKKKDLTYYKNLVKEVGETYADIRDLIKQSWNTIVQIVNLVGQLIPVARKIVAKLKGLKAKI